MRGFYMDEAFTGSPSDLQHISHDTNFTAKQWVDNTSASLAPIEATSTASQPYTVGKRLVYGGRLYKVTQAIAQGGTLTPGTNITPDTVDEELSTISTHLANNTFGTRVALSNNVDYVCPSDGYMCITCTNFAGNTNYAYGFVNGSLMLTVTANENGAPLTGIPYASIFVKKGMTIKFAGGTGTGSFIPLE